VVFTERGCVIWHLRMGDVRGPILPRCASRYDAITVLFASVGLIAAVLPSCPSPFVAFLLVPRPEIIKTMVSSSFCFGLLALVGLLGVLLGNFCYQVATRFQVFFRCIGRRLSIYLHHWVESQGGPMNFNISSFDMGFKFDAGLWRIKPSLIYH